MADPVGSVLLTGPTGGLGKALLAPLARRRPAHLVLLGRDPRQLQAAAQSARTAGARDVSVVAVDLGDRASVAAAAHTVVELVTGGVAPLSALVLNAGVQLTDRRQVNSKGEELTFAVNVLANHQLLRGVLPAARAGAHAVLVGSGTHFGDWHSYGMVPAPRWQDPVELTRPDALPDGTGSANSAGGGRAYATSKLALLHLAHAWQRRHGDRLRVNVFDPGLMPGTGLARSLTGLPRWAWHHAMPALTFLPGWSTPSRSAQQLAAFALGEKHAALAGGYVEIGRERRSSHQSYDVEREQRLWQVCDELTEEGTA